MLKWTLKNPWRQENMINLSLKIKVKSGLHQKRVGAGVYEWSSAKSTDIWNLVSGASALITTIIYQHWGVRVCTDRAPSCGETRSWASIKASSARMLTEEATASCQTSTWTRQSRWMRINQLFLLFFQYLRHFRLETTNKQKIQAKEEEEETRILELWSLLILNAWGERDGDFWSRTCAPAISKLSRWKKWIVLRSSSPSFPFPACSRVMQVDNSSSSGALTGLCGGEEDERKISELVSPTGAASSFNLSLNCWLHILSQESSLDLHGDSANLAVGLLTFLFVCFLFVFYKSSWIRLIKNETVIVHESWR